MSPYTEDEGSKSSHFFINSQGENIYVLDFSTIDPSQLDFNNDFLQDNVYEMVVLKVSYNEESYCKKVANEIKLQFEKILNEVDNAIIYVNVKENSLKHKLVERYIANDTNSNYAYYKIVAQGNVYLFFINKDITSEILVVIGLAQFFKDELSLFEEDNEEDNDDLIAAE